jgi:hypothetical protein
LNGLSAPAVVRVRVIVSNPPPRRDREVAFTPHVGANFTASAAPRAAFGRAGTIQPTARGSQHAPVTDRPSQNSDQLGSLLGFYTDPRMQREPRVLRQLSPTDGSERTLTSGFSSKRRAVTSAHAAHGCQVAKASART